MENEAIKGDAYALIAETLGISPEVITDESKINDLSEDSIKLFELLLAFEKRYQIKTSYEDIIRLVTVGDIISYLSAHLAKRA